MQCRTPTKAIHEKQLVTLLPCKDGDRDREEWGLGLECTSSFHVIKSLFLPAETRLRYVDRRERRSGEMFPPGWRVPVCLQLTELFVLKEIRTEHWFEEGPVP